LSVSQPASSSDDQQNISTDDLHSEYSR
jgi:hypothetical protein